MSEKEYRKLFNNFSKNLRELNKKRGEDADISLPYEYIFLVRDAETKQFTNWATGVHDYRSGELVENIIHQIILDDFHDLGMETYDKSTYIEQVHYLVQNIISAGNERFKHMSDEDNKITDDQSISY